MLVQCDAEMKVGKDEWQRCTGRAIICVRTRAGSFMSYCINHADRAKDSRFVTTPVTVMWDLRIGKEGL